MKSLCGAAIAESTARCRSCLNADVIAAEVAAIVAVSAPRGLCMPHRESEGQAARVFRKIHVSDHLRKALAVDYYGVYGDEADDQVLTKQRHEFGRGRCWRER